MAPPKSPTNVSSQNKAKTISARNTAAHGKVASKVEAKKTAQPNRIFFPDYFPDADYSSLDRLRRPLTRDEENRFIAELREIAGEMKDLFGLTPKIYERYFELPNAMADVYSNTLQVDPRFPADVLFGVVYHEFGHLYFGDRIRSQREPVRTAEYEADIFAGYAAAFTGHSAKPMADLLRSMPSEPTHGNSKDRAESVKLGWEIGVAEKKLQEYDAVYDQLKAQSRQPGVAESREFREQLATFAVAYGKMVKQLGVALDVEEKVENALDGYPNLNHFMDRYAEYSRNLQQMQAFLSGR